MVGEVQQDVSQAGQVSKDEQQPPARGRFGSFVFRPRSLHTGTTPTTMAATNTSPKNEWVKPR